MAAQVIDAVREFIGDRAWTNIALVWVGIETRRAIPLLRALCSHYKLSVVAVLPRAQTEPGS